MNLQNYKKGWDDLSIKCNLSGNKVLEAVKQGGYALRYVKEQTEAICLEAVKQGGYALQYVKEQMFFNNKEEMTLEDVCKELGRTIKIIK